MPCYRVKILVSFVFLTVCWAASIQPIEDAASAAKQVDTFQIPPGLSIENLKLADNTRRGRTTQTPIPAAVAATTQQAPVRDDSDGVLYRLTENGRTCILILSDAIVQVNYVTNLKEKKEADVYIPSQYEPSGECNDDDAKFVISWKNFAWTLFFSKTPGGDHWYVSQMDLDANTQDKHLAHINRPPGKLHFSTAKDHNGMLFPTPIGRAYACNEETSVVLTEGDVVATILLRNLKMQPFIFKNDEFGPEYVCQPGGAKSYRDEAAPIAVGSTFAIISVLTVAGYGVYRYMKVKKVQYDTME